MQTEVTLKRALDAVAHLADPEPPWPEIIRNMSDVMRARGGGFVAFEGTQVVEMQGFWDDPAGVKEYQDHFYAQDILVNQDLSAPRGSGVWIDSETVLTKEERARNAYYHDFMVKHRMPHMMSFLVEESASYGASISFMRERVDANSAVFLASEPVERLTAALKTALARRRRTADEWVLSLEKSFGCFNEALCLVDHAGVVLHASPLVDKILGEHAGLRIRCGRFWHPVSRMREVVERAFARATFKAAKVSLLVPSERGMACTLEVVRSDWRPRLDQRAILIVRLKGVQPKGARALEGVCAAMGLTEAEGAVLRALVDGKTPSDLASAHGVSINTVRKQIASIMEKTGSERQIDLVRLALAC